MDKNPANLLMDLTKELQGLLIEDTFEVLGHKYTMRLLTEEETIWTYSFLNPKSTVSIAVASRLASLSIGLRAIDGIPIEECFTPIWEALSDPEQGEMLKEYKSSQMVYAKLVMDWLGEQANEFMNKMHSSWQSLEKRREDSQDQVKNLSGEDLEKEENKSTTESSQLGEQ